MKGQLCAGRLLRDAHSRLAGYNCATNTGEWPGNESLEVASVRRPGHLHEILTHAALRIASSVRLQEKVI